MPSEDAVHDIFVDLDAKRVSNLLGNSRTPESRIAALHFEDRRDEFLRGLVSRRRESVMLYER
jgi:hypothetical protein